MSVIIKTDERTVSLATEFMASHGKDAQIFALAWVMPDDGEHYPCCFLSRERLIEYAAEMQPHTIRVDDAELQAEMIEAALRDRKVH